MCKALKYFIIICLTVAFFVMITISVIDLLSGRTNYVYSIHKSKTLMPSWTLCPWLSPKYSIPADQVNEKLGNGTKIPFNLTVYYDGKLLTDPKVLKENDINWEDMWSVHCKFFWIGTQCIPCVTLTAPNNTFLETIPVK